MTSGPRPTLEVPEAVEMVRPARAGRPPRNGRSRRTRPGLAPLALPVFVPVHQGPAQVALRQALFAHLAFVVG